jgi:coenzyme Q-binding protein COQ10
MAANVERTETFDVGIDQIYNVIIDYKKYPEFVAGVDEIEILEQDDNGARVKYSLNLIKKFSYILKLTHEKPNKISWVLESGDLFKNNTGSWEMSDLGDGKTEVTYKLNVDFKVLAPKMIVNKLVSSNFPAMMKAYHQRAKEA